MHNKITPKPIPQGLDPRIKPMISNPTVQQAHKMDDKSTTKATFEDISEQITKAEVAGILKPKDSKYEPNPVLFKLPSMGKSIPSNFQHALTDNKEIYIRRISSTEEKIIAKLRTEPHRILNIITEVLEKCIKTNIPMKYYMTLDKIPMFLFLLEISYSDTNNKIEVSCPKCQQKQLREINISKDINIRYMEKDLKYPLSIHTDKSYADKYLIEFDAPLFEHETLFDQEELEAAQLLRNLVINITDLKTNRTVPKEEWLNLINYLDFDDRIAFRDEIAKISDKYGTDVKIDFSCENKGCADAGESIKVDLPLDQIFINLAKTKTI
jgi:hypothetical protein